MTIPTKKRAIAGETIGDPGAAARKVHVIELWFQRCGSQNSTETPHVPIFFGDHDRRAIPWFTGFSSYGYTMTLKGAAAHGNQKQLPVLKLPLSVATIFTAVRNQNGKPSFGASRFAVRSTRQVRRCYTTSSSQPSDPPSEAPTPLFSLLSSASFNLSNTSVLQNLG